jgi:hypothetical protein
MTETQGIEDLYIFDFRTNGPNTTLSDRVGITATLLSNKTFILRVNLTTSVDVMDGTIISCGNPDQRDIASSLVPVNVIGNQCMYACCLVLDISGFVVHPGPASAPTIIISPQGLTTLTVDMTVPNTGEICVDNYKITLTEDGIGGMRLSQDQVVTDATQRLYHFEFEDLVIDLCRELQPSYTATATAVTNGIEEATATFSTPVNVDKTSK